MASFLHELFINNYFVMEEQFMSRTFKIMLILMSIIIFLVPYVVQAKQEMNEEIIYNILVDRFNIGVQEKSEDIDVDDPYAYHGGDIQGITSKLGEIEGLGYNVISISPIMQNADNGYHGYWITDFFEVEAKFGTIEDLRELVQEAHKRDIKVIMELVLNYASKNHPFAQDESKVNWFKQVDLETTDSTYWLEDVVAFNQEYDEVSDYLLEVADFWMDEVDGFNLHAVDQMSPDFLEKLMEHIKEKDSSFYVIGNILDSDESNEPIEEISGLVTENYTLSEKLIDVFQEAGASVSGIHEAWEASGQHQNILFVDNEHMKRFSQAVAEEGRNSTTAWKLALTYMYTSPHVPYIFQGSELTMYGDGFPETQRLVPFHSSEPELEQFFYKIAALKKEFPSLQYGTYEQVATDGAMSVFKRSYEEETVYIAINNDEESRVVFLSDVPSGKRLKGVLNDNLVRESNDGTFSVSIPRESVEVYTVEDDTGFNWWFIGFLIGVFLLFVIAVIYLSNKQKARST